MRNGKTRSLALLAIALAVSLPASVRADAWDDYRKVLATRYMLDDQPVGSITCTVSVPLLDKSMADAHARLPANTFNITETLNSFTVTYDKARGVTYGEPVIDIKMLAEPGNSTTQADLDRLKNGFAQTISGTEEIVTPVIEEMTVPKRGSMQDLAVAAEGQSVRVSYAKGEQKYEETITGAVEQSRQSIPGGLLEGTISYGQFKDKLVMTGSAMRGNSGADRIEMNMQVSYQDLGKALFPARIGSDLKVNGEARPHIDVNLKNCSAR